MSHRHHFPTRLLCLTAISCLTSLGLVIQPHDTERPPASTGQSSVEHESTSLRNPADQVAAPNSVVTASYIFNAPPLPQPGGTSTAVNETGAPQPPNRQSLPPSNSLRQSDVRSPSVIVRLPKTESKVEESRRPLRVVSAPAKPTDQWQPAIPAAIGPRLVRLPPVEEALEPPTPGSIDQPVVTKRRMGDNPPHTNGSIDPPRTPAPTNPLRSPRGTRTSPKLRAPEQPHFAPRVSALPITHKPREPAVNHASIDNAAVQTSLQPTPGAHAPHESPRDEPENRAARVSRLPGPDPALVAVSRQAMELVRKGQALAVRNAQYSARADFIQALRLIAQSHDAVEGGSRHTRHLSAGLLALREAEDFVASGAGRWTDQFDVRVIASGHGTPVIRESEGNGGDTLELTTWVARQKYYTFAQQQLAQAGANEPVASSALFSLGKLYVARNGTTGKGNLVSSAEAMAYFQAALQVDARNYNAANELGVLLARLGQLDDARSVLRHAVAVRQDFPPIWNNLAVVHQRMGEVDLAQRARHELELARRQATAGQSATDIGDSILWVAPEAFASVADRPTQPRSAARPPVESSVPEQQPAWRFWK